MHWRLFNSWFRSINGLGVDEKKKKMHCFHGPNLKVQKTETSWLLRLSEIGEQFLRIRIRITKHFAFYRCIIVGTCDLNTGG